ncbi:Uncharacterised protein [uncultured archaeon]|nr:Uncharacterised protein [uncultured archaeon]
MEWLVPPVVENTPSIEAKEVPGTAEYLQVAASSVERETVVLVVPAGSAPVGCPLLLAGGVVSCGGGAVLTFMVSK